MAGEIHKIEKDGKIIYPATTTDAVINLESRKTVKKELADQDVKTENISVGYNIVNYYKRGYVNTSGGITLTPNTDKYKYVIFPVSPGQQYMIYSDRINNLCAYMITETTQLSRFTLQNYRNRITIPPGAAYLAITLEFTTSDIKQGDWIKQSANLINPYQLDLINSVDKSDAAYQIVEPSKNLFDKNSVVNGFYISTTSGELSNNATSAVSSLIPIIGGQMYYLSGRNSGQTELLFLDSYGNKLKPLDSSTGAPKASFALGYQNGQVLAPLLAVYIQFTINLGAGTFDAIQFEKGNSQTSYSKYSYAIKSSALQNVPTNEQLQEVASTAQDALLSANLAECKVNTILSDKPYRRINYGENTASPQYLRNTANTANVPKIEVLADTESPFKDLLGYKRFISNPGGGTGSIYKSETLQLGTSRPKIITVSYWMKESDVRAIWTGNMEIYLALGTYEYNVINLLNNIGTKQVQTVTPNISQYSKGILTAYFAEKRGEYVKLVQQFEITWKDTFTGTTLLYYFIWTNVRAGLTANGQSLYNLTFLFKEIDNGIFVYADPNNAYPQYPQSIGGLQSEVNEANVQISELWDAISENTESCRVQIIGEELFFTSPFSATQELVRRVNVKRIGEFTNNPTVNLVSTMLISKGNGLNTGTTVKNSGDDICPANLNSSYIGGNHGWNAAYSLTIANNGKTVADVGSRWKDANNRMFTILRAVDINTLWICSDNQNTDGFNYSFVAPSGTLTYVSDGANTTSMTGYTTAGIGNLYNTIIENSRKTYLNGNVELTDNDIYNCAFIDIVEDYDALDLPSVLAALTANRPSGGYTVNPQLNAVGGDKLINHNITYRFMANGTTLIIHNFFTYKKVNMNFHGFIQSGVLKGSLYMPKGLPISDGTKTWDFRKIEPWQAIAGRPALYFTPEYWEDPASPPDRLVNFNSNVGLHLGYLFDRGIGKLRREDSGNYLKRAMFLNTPSGKLYPMGVSMTAPMEANQFLSCVAFRSWYNPSNNPSGRINYTWFELYGKVYIYLDYNATIRDIISISSEWQGKKIMVNEKTDNVVILGDTVVNKLQVICTIDSNNVYGYAVIVLE